MNSPHKLVIAGGTGFLGRCLARWFDRSDREVVVLSRRPDSVTIGRAVPWDGQTQGPWTRELEGATAVINLAGRSVNCRYHARNRKLILASRIQSTRAIGEAIRNCRRPPEVWLNASTATLYRHNLGPAHGEEGEIGATPEAKDAFSVEVARSWERAFFEAGPFSGTRQVALRMALVLGAEPGGVLDVLRRLVRLGLGGPMAGGSQFVSWIHAEDCCRAIEWLLTHPRFEGPCNLAAPNPVTNDRMMALLREVEGVPFGLPAPAWLLEIGAAVLRTETELVLKSRNVIPERLRQEDFEFLHPEFGAAVRHLHHQIDHPNTRTLPRLP